MINNSNHREDINSGHHKQRFHGRHIPKSKLFFRKKINGDITSFLDPNQLEEDNFSKNLKKEYDHFAIIYLASRTKIGLP